MKRKKTNLLTCERARVFPIEKALEKLGHFPTKSTGKEAWFLSPFRSETQASFKVCKKLNRWYDHGAGKGGNVIDLVCLIKSVSVKEALLFIAQDQISFSFHQQPMFKKEPSKGIIVREAHHLRHRALIHYLESRKISLHRAWRFCKELHYTFKGKKYFAIGLQNNSGGWELRNKYVKNSSSPKDSTLIENGHNKLIITEGMFDFLSLLETNPNLELEYDFLILNSTAFVNKGIEIMDTYEMVDLYLDTDANGHKITNAFLIYSEKCRDMSRLYSRFKDVNEWLMAGPKVSFEHGMQDVSLLPQRPTCFTPDGRKEGKE